MATSTVTLITTTLGELEAHLPALLAAESLPAVVDWCYGQRELTAITRTPMICVDVPDFDQEAHIGGTGKRATSILVYAIVASPTEATLHQQLHGFMDLITKCLESEVTIGTAKLSITGADSTPTLRSTNALIRACAIEARLTRSRNRGDS